MVQNLNAIWILDKWTPSCFYVLVQYSVDSRQDKVYRLTIWNLKWTSRVICPSLVRIQMVIVSFFFTNIQTTKPVLLDKWTSQCCQIWRFVAIWATFWTIYDQYFALATSKFGYFLGYFSKIVIKTCLNRFLAWFLELWCRYFWILGGLWCRSFGVFKNLATFSSNFLATFSSNFLAALATSSAIKF